MKIFLTGVNGQVGSACYKLLASRYHVIAPLRLELDLSDLAALENTLIAHQPDIVINAAAYTNVDGAETQKQKALVMNRDVPKTLAQFCHRSGGVNDNIGLMSD